MGHNTTQRQSVKSSIAFMWRCHQYLRRTVKYLEGLKILTFPRHSWPSSCEGFFSVPHLLWQRTSVYKLMVISEDLWHSQLVLSVWRWICHYLCLKLSSKVVLQPFLMLVHHIMSYVFNAVSYCNTDNIFFLNCPRSVSKRIIVKQVFGLNQNQSNPCMNTIKIVQNKYSTAFFSR